MTLRAVPALGRMLATEWAGPWCGLALGVAIVGTVGLVLWLTGPK